MMIRARRWLFVSGFLSLFVLSVPRGSADPEGCLACHNGIEPMGGEHADLDCVLCHMGDDGAADKERAHENLIRNPGDLNVVEDTCGSCHEEIVEAVKKSLHATSAGVISGARYTWGAQDTRNALYGVRAVRDEDGDIPGETGALAGVAEVPRFSDSGEPVDDYLRNQCLRCHLWTEGARRIGDYRSSGCSACHVVYADDGLSRSGDPTIPKDEPGHPIRHEITSRIPSEQCVHCHNRGGRTGVSYLGMMEADPYGTPYTGDGSKQGKLHGKYYNRLHADLHLDAGLHCIDCHTSAEIHGDGKIYSKREQATEVECETCHGTVEEYSRLTTSRGNRMPNLRRANDRVVLRTKLDPRDIDVPQVRGLADREELPTAMGISGHMERLECYACHAPWAPQCYGCHAKMDTRKKGRDWVAGEDDAAHAWQESRSYLRWETPTLGINTKGKVSPFVTGCQAIFTQIGSTGKALVTNKVFTTAHGHSGLAHNPIQPHTISRRARPCENCHSSSKALGLGSGHYVTELNGVDVPFELERIVDEDGNQLQATSHDGARPFNAQELQKIRRTGVCGSCHKETATDLWKTAEERWGEAETGRAHSDLLHRILLEGLLGR